MSFSGTSILVGDEVGGLLLEYAAELGGQSKADTVRVNGIASDGFATEATYVFNAGSNVMSQSVTTERSEPENARACEYLSEHLHTLRHPPVAVIEDRAYALPDFDY